MSNVTLLIRELRSSGMTQTELARRTGVPQSRLSRWEAGATPAAVDDALKIQRLHAELLSQKESRSAHAH